MGSLIFRDECDATMDVMKVENIKKIPSEITLFR